MTSTVVAAGSSAAGAALVTALLVLLVLPRLPEPADGDGKPLYRDLAHPSSRSAVRRWPRWRRPSPG